jgi:cytohesin
MMRELILRDLSLWDCLWQGLVFLALGLAAARLLRRRPSRAYAVLLLAMIAAALVPFLSAVVRHGHLGAFPAAPEEASHVLPYPSAPRAGPEVHVRPALNVSSPVTDVGPGPSLSAPVRIPWRMILLSAWLSATLLLMTRLVVMLGYGARLVRQAQRSECEDIQQIAEHTASRLHLATGLQIRASDRIHSPVVWCWTRPPILLVPRAPGRPEVEWTGVVAHELAHCRRRDHLTGFIAELMASLLPWNPLMWVARRFLIRLGEQACDDWVVASGQSSEDYAESLLRFRPQKQMAFWPAVVSSKSGLAYRIRRILNDACGNPRAGAKWALMLSSAVLSIGLGVAFAQTRPAPSESPAKPEEKPTPSLHQAAAAGDRQQVDKLLPEGANVNERGPWGYTPLHRASMRGNVELAKLLISKGAYVNAPDGRDGMMPLHHAAASGNIQSVELLLSKGADLDAKQKGGRTPLFEAMKSTEPGRKEIVELLVAKGAKVPALHLAAYMGDMDKLKKCLEDGADVNIRGDDGGTALHAAACSGRKDIVELLISRGANVDPKDGSGMTPLYYAATHNAGEIVDLLVAKGADVNAKGESDFALLHYAIFQDQSKDAVNLLLSKGANINVKDEDGFTPLIWALWWGGRDMMELLLSKGADVNQEDNYGVTAVYYGRKDLLNLLIAKGAAPLSAIHSAVCAGDLAKVKSLVEAGTDVDTRAKGSGGQTPLFAAVFTDRNDVAEFLIAKGADVNAKDRAGVTPLQYACEHGMRNMAELLIAKGADVNAKSDVNAKDGGGRTALHRMFWSGVCRMDIAELLIAKGANVNARDREGMTPLHNAVESGHTEIVRFLIGKGGDIDAPKTDGQTPLHIACKCGHKDMAELLVAKGANLNAKDNKGRTPLSLAKEQGHKEIVEFLQQHGAKE